MKTWTFAATGGTPWDDLWEDQPWRDPALEEIANELEGQVTIAKLNVDENPGVAGAYGIRTIPTLMLFKDGKMTSSKIGAAPKGELKRWITEAI